MTMTQNDQLEGAKGDASPAVEKESVLKRLGRLEITPRKLPRKELMHFSRQLAVFVKAGIPILEALESIREEAGNKLLREILADIGTRLQQGETFAAAAAAHPEAFPEFYLGVLRSAEYTGTLDTVLVQLADYIERDIDARRRVTSALVYPSIIVVMAIVVVVVLVTFVLPRFETFFKSLDAKLPLATRILLSVAHGTHKYWYIEGAVVAGLLLGFLYLWSTPNGNKVRDRLILKIPVLGDLIQHVIIERFCRVLAALTEAGVTLPEALAVISGTTGNWVFRDGLKNARAGMLRGEGIAAPLAATGLFPASARQMLRVGEDTGTLDVQLQTAATFFDRELDYKIKRFTSLFEPAVIVFVGVLVGFVAIALVSAMYGIYRQVHV
jgi:type IV pilus assembly protein PilC